MRITVVLQGAPNDKEAFQAAVRMAAREGAKVRVVLGGQCSREMFEKHLDFVLWDVRERLRLTAPRIDVEVPLDRFSVAVEEVHAGSARS
ncbi:MAG TPA: hypothetical protein VK009_10890 [Chloroflexota bacterium]|nr:hypothetical protein [Chloroflexota bacterium]